MFLSEYGMSWKCGYININMANLQNPVHDLVVQRKKGNEADNKWY